METVVRAALDEANNFHKKDLFMLFVRMRSISDVSALWSIFNWSVFLYRIVPACIPFERVVS